MGFLECNSTTVSQVSLSLASLTIMITFMISQNDDSSLIFSCRCKISSFPALPLLSSRRGGGVGVNTIGEGRAMIEEKQKSYTLYPEPYLGVRGLSK